MFDRIAYRARGLGALIVGIMLLATACGPQERPLVTPTATLPPTPASGRGAGDTLRIMIWQAPTNLNPHLTENFKDWEAGRLSYEPLASFDKDGVLIAHLAAEIPSVENGGIAPDFTAVTWKLKQNVMWSDGTPFTADDVIFTYEFITNPAVSSGSANAYRSIKSVEKIDTHSIRVQFVGVTPAWSTPFVGMQGVILPRHIFQDFNGANAREAPANRQPVGTGPYRMVGEIRPQEVILLGSELIETIKIIYEPNPFYRDPSKPYFSRVELRGGGSTLEAARLVFQTGDVDYAWNLLLPAETLTPLEQLGKGAITLNLGSAIERLYLNRADPNRESAAGERSTVEFPHPFLQHKEVRQAISFAIDRDSIVKLYPGSAATGNLLVAPASYQSPSTSYEFNLDKARALLDGAGWVDSDGDGIREKDGVKLSLTFRTTVNAVRQQTQQIIKKDLEAIGMQVTLEVVDASSYFDASKANSYIQFQADMVEHANGNQNPDPGAYMQRFTCEQIPTRDSGWKGGNVERWCNAEYDALYTASTTEIIPEERRALFIKMNDILVNDIVDIPMVQRANISGVAKDIEGVNLTPWDADLWNIQDWTRVSR